MNSLLVCKLGLLASDIQALGFLDCGLWSLHQQPSYPSAIQPRLKGVCLLQNQKKMNTCLLISDKINFQTGTITPQKKGIYDHTAIF